jgi:hypothetical protein
MNESRLLHGSREDGEDVINHHCPFTKPNHTDMSKLNETSSVMTARGQQMTNFEFET